MKDKEKAQDIATQRAMLIAPLLSHDLDRGEARMHEVRAHKRLTCFHKRIKA